MIEAEPGASTMRLGQRRHVAHADIEPLPRERMHGVRGIADQREPIGHEAARDLHVERKGLARTGEGDLAETEAEALAELGEKARLRRTP